MSNWLTVARAAVTLFGKGLGCAKVGQSLGQRLVLYCNIQREHVLHSFSLPRNRSNYCFNGPIPVQRRQALTRNADRLRQRLAGHGISTAPSTTHIIPVVIGDNATTMAVCEALLECGFYAQGIRHPSVPKGTARLRVTPMATHSVAEIDAVGDAIAEQIAKYPAELIPALQTQKASSP